jgi:hypothetical protein
MRRKWWEKKCGNKKENVTGERRKLHNEELHNLYCPVRIIMVIKPGNIWGMRNIYQKTSKKGIKFGKLWYRWEKRGKTDPTEIGWMKLAQNRIQMAGFSEYDNDISDCIKCGTFQQPSLKCGVSKLVRP